MGLIKGRAVSINAGSPATGVDNVKFFRQYKDGSLQWFLKNFSVQCHHNPINTVDWIFQLVKFHLPIIPLVAGSITQL